MPYWNFEVNKFFNHLNQKELEPSTMKSLSLHLLELIELDSLISLSVDTYNPYSYYSMQSTRLSRISLRSYFSKTISPTDAHSQIKTLSVTDK